MANSFPPVDQANEDGLLAIGGDLDSSLLIEAYSQGIFPWPLSANAPLTWFSPDPRGIILFDNLRVTKSLNRLLNKEKYQVVFNQNFELIIKTCAQTKKKSDKQGTWITMSMIRAYIELFKMEKAFCVEVYEQEELVGGLYGVCLGDYICGESMFYLKPNASKIALLSLINKLKSNGNNWIDTQMITPIVQSFGGSYIPRTQFIKMLKAKNFNIKRDNLFR